MFEGSQGRQFSPVQAGTGRRPRCGRMQGDTGRGADGHGRHRQSPDKDEPRGAAERGVRPNEGRDGVSERAVLPAAGRDKEEASSAQLRDAAEAPGMTARGTTSPSASDAAGEAQAVALMREMLRNMQQLVQSGKAPPGINANTLALMKMRMEMMASMVRVSQSQRCSCFL